MTAREFTKSTAGTLQESPDLEKMWQANNALYLEDCYQQAHGIMLLTMSQSLDVPFTPALATRWKAASDLTLDDYKSAQRRGLCEAVAVLAEEGTVCPGLAKAPLADLVRYDPEAR